MTPRGRADTRPCSCWKSSRTRWQLCFCATLDARKISFSSFCFVSATFTTRKVIKNILSFLLCRSRRMFFASPA